MTTTVKKYASITRRRFLGAAAATVAAPRVLPGSVLGRDGRAAPSERVNLGLIGRGWIMGARHVPLFLGQVPHGSSGDPQHPMDDVRVLAVCDVDTNRRLAAKKQVEEAYREDRAYGGCAEYNDYRELLARPDIDAVCIATPDHWHALGVIHACQAGKDVFCEKPLTLTLREAQRIVQAVGKHQRVFQTGTQRRASHHFCHLVELIRSGRMGKIHRVEVSIGNPSYWCDLPEEAEEPGLDWDLWLGPAPERPYHSILSPRGVHDHAPQWRRYREYAGGRHADLGAHLYDVAQWALDLDRTSPVEVIPPEDPQAVRGVRYRYENGVEMVHAPGASAWGPGNEIIVFHGEAGTLRSDRGARLVSDPPELAAERLGDEHRFLYRAPGLNRNWIECIKSRETPVADVEAGARTAAISILGNLAYWNRRPLRFDPQRWQFVDDDEANGWLDYERRDPWQLPEV